MVKPRRKAQGTPIKILFVILITLVTALIATGIAAEQFNWLESSKSSLKVSIFG
jgi:hypothetical protein